MSRGRRPIIGITPDVAEPRPGSVRLECALAYARAVERAGGHPIILTPLGELIPEQIALCAGFLLTGGDDPRMEMFDRSTHGAAKPMHAERQAYEVSLLRALERPELAATPTLGVCLGMQLMALCGGGDLNQHMPDDVLTAADHGANSRHTVRATAADGVIGRLLLEPGVVVSHHRQAVRDSGRLRTVARAEDGVIEAIDDPARRFYVGVQWHPERTPEHATGQGIIEALVEAARG